VHATRLYSTVLFNLEWPTSEEVCGGTGAADTLLWSLAVAEDFKGRVCFDLLCIELMIRDYYIPETCLLPVIAPGGHSFIFTRAKLSWVG
jgi:hypothetical protein